MPYSLCIIPPCLPVFQLSQSFLFTDSSSPHKFHFWIIKYSLILVTNNYRVFFCQNFKKIHFIDLSGPIVVYLYKNHVCLCVGLYEIVHVFVVCMCSYVCTYVSLSGCVEARCFLKCFLDWSLTQHLRHDFTSTLKFTDLNILSH